MEREKIKNLNLSWFSLLVFSFFLFPLGARALDVCGDYSATTDIHGDPPSSGINYSSSADSITAGAPVTISASCENGSLSGSTGTFYPASSTTYYATCTQGDVIGGSYSATACVNVSVDSVSDNGCAAGTCTTASCWNSYQWVTGTQICADNSCAALICANKTCWNNLTWIPGIKDQTYSAYHCYELDTAINAFCAITTNCGLKTTTTVADFACTATDDCTGLANGSRPIAECSANSVPCPSTTKTIQCPGCPLRVNKFIETAPQ